MRKVLVAGSVIVATAMSGGVAETATDGNDALTTPQGNDQPQRRLRGRRVHEVTPVTKGRRFCTLPFLRDEAAEQIRVRNQVLRSR